MEQSVKQRIADIQRGNVPAGYRKTKRIGIFPEKWSKTKIGDFIQFYNEKSTQNNQYPVLTSARSGLFFQKDYFEDQVTTENNTGYNIIPRGFFTYRSRSDDGSFYFNRNTIIDRGVISCFYPVFQFDTTKVDSNYIFICLNELLKEQVFCEVAGTSQLVLSEKMLSQMTLILPQLEEQRRIAEILGCCDRVIALKKELIAEKKKQKKALMQKLLNPNSGFRLPGFTGEWKKTTLGELAANKGEYGINAPACEYAPGLPRYIRITDIDEHCKFITANGAYVNISDYESFLLKPADIVFVRTGGTVGKSYVYDSADGELVFAGFLIRFNFQFPKADYRFIKQIVFSEEYFRWISIMSARSGQPGINAEEYASYSFFAPDLKEQQAIADILSAADKEIDLLEQELSQQEQKKKSLMQLLLTGIVRV